MISCWSCTDPTAVGRGFGKESWRKSVMDGDDSWHVTYMRRGGDVGVVVTKREGYFKDKAGTQHQYFIPYSAFRDRTWMAAWEKIL